MHLSRRADRLAESATGRAARKAAELRAAGRTIIDWSAGQPDFASPEVAVEAARRALAEGFTRYTAAAGTPDLRRALAAHYAERHGAPWTIDQVMVTVGGKAALFELMMTLIDEGDSAVIPSPCWVTFPEQVRFAGGRPILVPTAAADGFAIHAQPVIDAIEPETRLVLLNSPCNPTGGIIAARDLRRIVEHCAERGIVVLSDETYERFLFDGREHASAGALAAEFPDTVVVVGSFSKTYAMTGWRIGFALASAPLIAKVTAVQSHATSNATSFAMRGAEAALTGADDDVERMLAAFARRRDLLVRGLERLPGVSCPKPAGAFYAFPHVAECYRPGRQGSLEFAEALLEDAGVAIVPGLAFGADDHVRISFACSSEELEAGLERLAEALRP
ncbi:MAG: pyridoxal phosphate-dependent aminotransferase [bacterium]|nr:pyridoxal phosphate-dependent aminotransferase [bacterium]